jgi:release factor glutamine methyltransferase
MTREEEWLLNEKYQGERSEEFFADSLRLQDGEPLAYVIGHIPFLNARIFLDSRPLIPRSETEFWVEVILQSIPSNATVLDLCAGSGAIGVAVAMAFPMTRVDFAEIDAGHHATIKKNTDVNGIDLSRVRIFGGDLFENITDVYDVILTNPPYIDRTLNRTDASVLSHEPHDALFAEQGGLALIEQIIMKAPEYLSQHGVLVIEHEPEQSDSIRMLSRAHGFTPYTKRDQYNVERYTLLTRSAT